MFVRNFYRVLASHGFGGGAVSAVDQDGKTISVYPSTTLDFNLDTAIGTSTAYTSYIRLGTGDTPPTLDDFKLSGDFVTSIASTVAAGSIVVNGDSISQSATYTITNTGSTEITIKEIAIFSGNKSTSSGYYKSVMIERSVLDSPVTIPAGGVGQVNYTIRLNLPA